MTFVLLAGMIMSGLQIYGAYARFGERGGPYYVNAFEDHAFPTWSRLGGGLAGGVKWHFTLVWAPLPGGPLFLSYLPPDGGRGAPFFFAPPIPAALQKQKEKPRPP